MTETASPASTSRPAGRPGGGRPAAARFPAVELLDALRALSGPTAGSGARDRVRNALGSLLEAAGMAGAYLELDTPPLPAVAVGAGSLPDRAALERPGRGAPAARRLSTGLDTPLGTLWLDGPARAADMTERVITLAVDAAWSRVRLVQTGERLAALDAASRDIAGVQAIDTVLQTIVERVCDLVQARYAALGIIDRTGAIEKFVTVGVSPEERARIGHPPHGLGLLGLIIREGRSYRIADISAHPDSAGFPPHHPRMRSFLGVPVRVKGTAVGNLYLADKIGAAEFSDDDLALVETFALHAGIAIENARLHEQVQRLAIVEERERIAKDLHDGIIQSIYAVGLSLEDIPELMDEDPDEARARVDRAIEALHVTIRDIRNFIMGLRPELLDQHDLLGSLEALSEEVRLNSLLEVDTAIEPEAAAAVPEHARAAVFHITREALSNIVRHAHATRAAVVLRRVERDGGGRALRLEVRDNGVGFDPDEDRAAGHQGLANMAARAARHGGRLTVESAPGAGTRIIVAIDEGGDGTQGSPHRPRPRQQEVR